MRELPATCGGLEVEGAGGSGAFAVGEVEVDHGGGDVGVAEDVLEGADVGVGIEEMGGEAVPEDVAGDALGDVGFLGCFFELPLHGVFEEVVAGEFTRFRMCAEFGCREEKAPGEIGGGVGVFSLEGEGKVDGGTVGLEVLLVLLPESREFVVEAGLEAVWEWHDAVFPSFGVVDLDGSVVEIEVFDAEGHGFADAQAGSVHDLGGDFPRVLELFKKLLNFLTAQDGGRALVFAGLHGRLDDEFAVLEDGPVKEDEGVESLLLGGGGDVSLEDEVVEVGSDGVRAEVLGGIALLLVGEVEVGGDPLAVCFLGGDGFSGEAKVFASAIQDVVLDGKRLDRIANRQGGRSGKGPRNRNGCAWRTGRLWPS